MTIKNTKGGAKMKAQKWLVCGDLHFPNVDVKSLEAVMHYISDHKWDGILLLGDVLDFDAISKYNQGAPRRRNQLIKGVFAEGKAFFTRLRKTVGNARIVYLEGNHEFRTENYEDVNPELSGFLDIEENLSLSDLKVEYIKSWSRGKLFKLGNAYFTHGKFTNIYHAKKMATAYGACIYYGHTHDVMEIPAEMWGDDKTIVGKSLGCLCEYQQKYLKGAPTKWQQAFAVFHFFTDGFYSEITTRIFKHRFLAEGKIYQG